MPEKKCWEIEIINAGFKAVAAKVHPDKPGGSKEAMQDLGVARERLKLLLNKFREYEETQQIKNTVGYQVPNYPAWVNYRPQYPITNLITSFAELLRNGERIMKEARRTTRKRK